MSRPNKQLVLPETASASLNQDTTPLPPVRKSTAGGWIKAPRPLEDGRARYLVANGQRAVGGAWADRAALHVHSRHQADWLKVTGNHLWLAIVSNGFRRAWKKKSVTSIIERACLSCGVFRG